MSLPHIFSLSNELLIEIISNLRPVDIYACRCTCRRLNSVIINSYLIQYIMRTALSGVFDPLEPGLSLPDRLDALERWETAWMEMDLREPNAIINQPVFVDRVTRPGRRIISAQYFIMYHERIGESAFYSFLDIHAMSSHTNLNAARWTTIEIDTPIFTFAFAPELNLAVAISVPIYIDQLNAAVTISPLRFNTGEPHPLAFQPKLEVIVSGSSAFNIRVMDMTIIGDYILYWVGNIGASLRCIYLVAWKEGWISEVSTSLQGLYSSAISVLSEEVILLVRLREPALELCRLSNIDDREKASLETARILYLPVLTASTSLWGACLDGYPGHMLFSKNHQQHPSLQRDPHSSSSSLSDGRSDTCRHLHSVPMDGIIVILMQLYRLSDITRMFELTVRRRTLLELSNAYAQAGAAGTGTGTGVGTALTVPWEKWGPNKTHILEHDSDIPRLGGSFAGERHATVLPMSITIRDYNRYRVRRALALLGGAGRAVTLENGSIITVVKEPVYRGGEWFREDIETNLPYVQTAVPYNWCNEILMDKDNLVVERTTQMHPAVTQFYLYSL